jgi:hypothetical protein
LVRVRETAQCAEAQPRLREQTNLQFRLERFNAFNHPRFGAPNTDPGSANFGRVTPAQENTARLIQVALKLNF